MCSRNHAFPLYPRPTRSEKKSERVSLWCENRAKGHISAGEPRPGCARALPPVLKRGRMKHPVSCTASSAAAFGSCGAGWISSESHRGGGPGGEELGRRFPTPTLRGALPPLPTSSEPRERRRRLLGRQLGDLGFGESRRRLRAVVVGWSWKHLAEGTEDGTGWETLEVGGR